MKLDQLLRPARPEWPTPVKSQASRSVHPCAWCRCISSAQDVAILPCQQYWGLLGGALEMMSMACCGRRWPLLQLCFSSRLTASRFCLRVQAAWGRTWSIASPHGSTCVRVWRRCALLPVQMPPPLTL